MQINRINYFRKTSVSAVLALVLILTFLTTALAAGNVITVPDSDGNVGYYSSLELDSSGNPVIVYLDADTISFKVMHCNDPNCAGGDESITTPTTDIVLFGFLDMALDGSGNPVISYTYYDDPISPTTVEIRVMHCNDPNCAGGDESITTAANVDSLVVGFVSLALDSNGFPAVSYVTPSSSSFSTHNLTVLHCNDVNCSGGDESVEVVDVMPGASSTFFETALALDSSNNPVVFYLDDGSTDLKLLHCNDPNCAGGDESINVLENGRITDMALVLDASGNPVVAYSKNDNLYVQHCNDPNCAGGDENIGIVDDSGPIGSLPSLALDSSGFPVISSYARTVADLKIVHCNDVNCQGGDESITVPDGPDAVGTYSSLVLDSSGYPVVSYFDETNDDLKVLHCGDANCTPPTDSTPPVISANVSGTLGDNGWYVSDVNVSWTVSDDESAISSTNGCDPTLINSDTAGATLTCEATSDGGTNSVSVTIQRDATAPAVSVTGVTDGATYILGTVPAAGCDTQDALSGVATGASLTVSGGNSNGVGNFTATCDGATDNAGNSAPAVNISYNVVYDFGGFTDPIDPEAVNQVKAGQSIPVKFSLNGDQGLDIFADGYPVSQEVACDSSVQVNEVEETGTAGNSSLSYDPASDQYSYTWKTDKGWSGACHQLIVQFDDGSEYIAHFEFR